MSGPWAGQDGTVEPVHPVHGPATCPVCAALDEATTTLDSVPPSHSRGLEYPPL